MTLREKITESILKYASIPEGKVDASRRFYYKNYKDNLYCPLGDAALQAYDKGNGAETRPKGKRPAKMASIVSSSAMTFNLLGNDTVIISSDTFIPHGTYEIQYEKQMYTVKRGSNPANLDAFLSDEVGKTAIFCEMKFLEWLSSPDTLKNTYLDDGFFFKPDNSAVGCPIDAYSAFHDVIMKLTDKIIPGNDKSGHNSHKSIFDHYDAWQMLKHLLAIYNYTSFVTKAAVDSFGSFTSMAGVYNRIILLNAVNEFPPECVEDTTAREGYARAMQQERKEADIFIDIIRHSEIPLLFDNNCNARIEIKYVSAKQFAYAIEMPKDKRDYLRRYFS